MNRGDLADLNAFVAIADHLNFRAASTQLGVTASALSHTMRQLEERLADVATNCGGLTESRPYFCPWPEADMRPDQHWSRKMLGRSEQTTAPFCISPGLFCGGHVWRELLGNMHGTCGILPVRPQHALERLVDVTTLVSAQAIDRRGGLVPCDRL